jgi:hypothetical protein
MALTTTTLNGAVTSDQGTLLVTSATGFAAKNYIMLDQEIMQIVNSYVSGTTIPVIRGVLGSAAAAHVTASNVTTLLASDFQAMAPGTFVNQPTVRARTITSYSATGALTLPLAGSDAMAILNGTGVLAMTLANPTKDMDGCILIICGNGIAAHTVTYTAGFGNVGATADVMTFGTTQAQAFQCIAANGFWNLLGPLATATANVSGPALA